PKPGSYTMAIYDASGKLVRSDKFEVAEFGNNTLNYANDNFVQGVYYFNLISDTANAAKASFIW
nr:T9SS type A sorting domain-containing protein [Saprospiraceae bacterium]